MGEDMHEQLALGLQRAADLGHEKLVVLHVFEELDRDDSIKGCRLELVFDNVAGDYCQVLQAFLRCYPLDKSSLGS